MPRPPRRAARAEAVTLFRLLLGVALLWSAEAWSEVAVPPLRARVTDVTGTLSATEQATLEQRLADFERDKGAQLVLLMVPSTAPETIEQYGLRVAEAWRIGRAKVDDGAILLIAKEDRTLRIEVGYGLEGVLTDATSKRIISETIVPRFRQGEFYAGISDGLSRMMTVVAGEPLPPPKAARDEGADVSRHFALLFMLTLIAGGLLRAMFGRLPGATLTGGLVALAAWFLIGALSVAALAGLVALVFTLAGGTRLVGGPGLGGFGGHGGFGGRGGGFSGGGGGFGGGGASGRW
ncbi:MAG: YgcG family protein [Gammaproteobacteria bacterium]|nr:YgcG family protein [Gammaproteobacteria bacterium]